MLKMCNKQQCIVKCHSNRDQLVLDFHKYGAFKRYTTENVSVALLFQQNVQFINSMYS